MTPEIVVALAIAADHPAFAGHFPGRPVLPGALLLAMVLEAVAAAPALAGRVGERPQVEQAKFLAPVRPGEPVELRLAVDGPGVAFEVGVGDAIAARGRLLPG